MHLFFKAAREDVGLTQDAVGAAVDRSHSWVSRIETGDVSPTLHQTWQLLRLYRKHILDLVDFGPMPPPTRWPVALCAECQAKWTAALAAGVGEEAGPMHQHLTG